MSARADVAVALRDGQAVLASSPLSSHAAHRRDELHALYQQLDEQVDRLDARVKSTPPRNGLARPSS
jgi:hypothetical protein